jgi:hypothetical protein
MNPELNKKVGRINTAAERERLTSPEMIQKTKAVRYPSASAIRAAKVIENPAAKDNIKINLYSSKGIEQTTGDESNLDCYANISNGDRLDLAIPHLAYGDPVLVTQANYGDGIHWYFTSQFNGAKDKSFG